ncbi:MAG: PIN domain-containing protein [Acidimicrobiales bacterium]
MSPWLVDASVLLAREDTEDTNHAGAVRLLAGPDPLSTLDLAFYEVNNVAVRAWHDHAAALRLIQRVAALANDGGLIRADAALMADAAGIAREHEISAYDAAYVAAARSHGARLVSCDVRDLVSKGLAALPGDVPPDQPTGPGTAVQ